MPGSASQSDSTPSHLPGLASRGKEEDDVGRPGAKRTKIRAATERYILRRQPKLAGTGADLHSIMVGVDSKRPLAKVVLITNPADKVETPQSTDSEPDVGLVRSSSNEEADTSQ